MRIRLTLKDAPHQVRVGPNLKATRTQLGKLTLAQPIQQSRARELSYHQTPEFWRSVWKS